MKLTSFLVALLLVGTSLYAQQAPTVGSVVNAGSYAFAGLPNAAIAEGSLFIVFGTNMGPSDIRYASGFPLATNLAGTIVNVTVSGTTVQAPLIYTSAGQVAAIMPSRTPVGSGTLSVSFSGVSSTAFSIQVVQSNFGVITWNSQGSGAAIILDGNFEKITALHPAAPNQEISVWGTGLGPISGDDAQPPVSTNMTNIPVQVFVGTTSATVTYRGRTGYSGVDQVNFVVPPGQLGCNVSLTVKINNYVSNISTMAVSSGGPCSDPGGLSADALQALSAKGTISIGSVVLSRDTIQTVLPPPLSSTTTTSDGGAGVFQRYGTTAFLSSTGSVSTVSIGGCVVSTYLGNSGSGSGTGTYTGLDAGGTINVNGPLGNRQLGKISPGIYSSVLGGGNSPLYLGAGTYTIGNGSGGADVGAFQVSLTVGTPLTWLNQSSISTVNRSQDLVITWSGGGTGEVEIIGSSSVVSGNSSYGATFYCLAAASTGQFTVPSAVLLNLPPSSAAVGGGISIPTGYLYVGAETFTYFNASGIDMGIAAYLDMSGKNISFQ